MKILVTGGTGVVGTAAIPALLDAGHEIHLLSRHAEHDAAEFPAGVQAFPVDLGRDDDRLREAIAGCDGILHLAGIVEEHPPEITFDRINVAGTRRLLDAARAAGAPRLIYVSSLGADHGQSAYHRSKLRAEFLVRAYPGEWLILRPGAIYGPGDETLSMLLQMVRTLPAVPMVARGDQPFQPLWFADFGRVLVQALERRDLNRQVLELAGPETTTTEDVLRRLSALTDRKPARIPLPVELTELGVQALEAFDGAGKKLLRRAGIEAPLNPATLRMLLEGSIIPLRDHNALFSTFELTPTSLADGLQQLAELTIEQLPGEGVGALHSATYLADIHATPHDAAALLDLVCARLHDVMPLEFAAEPDAPESAHPGATMTAHIPGRGHIQVRLEERTPTTATFITLRGHPLAGVMQLETADLPDGVRFEVHIAAQPANAFDWLALRTIGGALQTINWRDVVRRVVQLSGGAAPGGVQHAGHTMDERETRDLRRFAERIVQRHHREHPAAK